jgi:hypothetical protein
MVFTLIICGVIIIISTVLAIKNRDITYAFIGYVGIAFFTLFWMIISVISIKIAFPETVVYKTESIPIYAMKDNLTSKGRFFLGSGSTDKNIYYYYFAEAGNGAKEIRKISSNNVKIYEDEDNKPYIKTEYTRCSNDVARFFFLDPEKETTSIHIPKDSINYQFSLDLE